MESKLYVGNLPYTATEEELSALFGQAGTVTSVAIIKDRETGRSKGFAFVEMSSSDEANKAINMLTGHMLGGRDLRVSIARPREEGGGGGGYGNRGGGNRGGGGYGNRGGGGGGGRRRDY
ncbi:MAG TPA: RNA-binding protein [Anaerolineales bacterium]|nr:RNA-binding protein [Anaerolineales bacterium]